MNIEPGTPDAFESNAGDDFHLQWAALKALRMLHPRSTLISLGLDQVHPEDVGLVERGGDSLLGIDLAEYYGGRSFNLANKVVHTQLKYSTRRADLPWTAALLSPKSPSESKKCIIRRLTEIYSHYAKQFGRDEAMKKLSIKLISNRPCHKHLIDMLRIAKQLLSNRQSPVYTATLSKYLTKIHVKQLEHLQRGMSLKSSEFTDFLRVFDVSECGAPSRLAMDAAIFKNLGELGFGEARSRNSMLMDSIRRRMQPENRGELPFVKDDVLAALEITSSELLYPAPSSFEELPNPIQRDITNDLAMQITNHNQSLICVHGKGGVGKTTLIRQLRDSLPTGSISVLFDCYGGGSYMNHESKRHGYQRAILQITNELAGVIGTPLLINQGLSEEDYSRELRRRLEAAALSVRAANPEALVVLVIDAADNSLSAAKNWAEQSFVSGLATLAVPVGCRLVFAARTHRRDQLGLPTSTLHFEVPPFSNLETQQHVERYCEKVNRVDVETFGKLTHGVPRTRAYALAQCDGDLCTALDFLRPGGKTLDHLIDAWLDDAGRRLGDEKLAEKICPALLTLARPVPLKWAAQLSEVDEASLVDFCRDAGLGFTVQDDAISFKDEDFENRIRDRYTIDKHQLGNLADVLFAARESDGYAAAHVADALRVAGRDHDIVSLIHNDGQPQSIKDPIERTEVFARRAQLAMDWVLRQGDDGELLRLLFVLAESGKADQAVEDLLLSEGDLAVRYGNPSTVHRLYINQQNTRLDWQGPMHLQCAAQFSRSPSSHVQAKNHLSSAEAWIREYFSRPREDRYGWDLTTNDIANGAEAVLRLNGVNAVHQWIAQWKPQAFRFELCKKLAKIILTNESSFDLNPIWKLLPRYEEVLAIIDGAMDAGHIPPKPFVAHVAKQWSRFGRSGHRLDGRLCNAGISLCEAAAHHGIGKRTILALLKLFTPVPTPNTYFSSVEELDEQYGYRLRALTIWATTSGRDIKYTDVRLYPSKPDVKKSNKSDDKLRRWEENKKKLEEYYFYLLPAYLFRAQSISAGTSLQDAEERFNATLGAGGHKWEWESKQREKWLLIRLRARVLADGLILACNDPVTPYSKLYQHLKRSFSVWMAKDLAERAARVTPLANLAMTIVSDFIDEIQESPSPASERVDAFTWACRIGGKIDPEIGRLYFKQAVEAAGEIDSECAAMLQLVALITDKATSDCRACHDIIALRMTEIVEDCHWRWQDGGREFPWNESMDAIAQLSPRTAIVALGRWDQRGFLKYMEETARLAATLAVQGSIDWRTAIAFATHSSITHDNSLNSGLRILDHIIQADSRSKGFSIDEPLMMLVDRACRLVTVGQREQSIEEILRWADGHGYRDHPVIVNARCYHDGIVALQSVGESDSDLRKPHRANAKAIEDKYSLTDKLWTDLVRKCDPFDPDAITTVIEQARAIAFDHKMQWEQLRLLPANLLDSIRQKVGLSDRTMHLDALINISTRKVSLTDLVEYLATVRDDWSNSPTVRQWFTGLPDLIARAKFSQLVYQEAVAWDVLTVIENELKISLESMASSLLKAAPPYIRALSPEVIYDLGQLVARRLTHDNALTLLTWVVDRLSQEINKSVLVCRNLDVDHIAPNGAGLAAAMLWFLMGHPDKQVRWQAIHAARGVVRLGDEELLCELAKWIDCGSAHPFYASGTVFYWLSAKTSFMILVDRLSDENPSAILPLGKLLATEATQPDTLHVMTMHLARNAAIRLAKHKTDIYDNNTLNAITRSLNPDSVTAEESGEDDNTYSRSNYRSAKTTYFDFDRIDTLPYWYKPAGEVFGIDGMKFCDDAGKVITDEWRIATVPHRDDPVHKWQVSDHNWQLCTSGHGSVPMVEDLRHYLEFHAMMCVMAKYAQSLPTHPERWDEGSKWDHWLLRWGLLPESNWISDRREYTPLESAFWNHSERFGDRWLDKEVDDHVFDQGVGLTDQGPEDRLVIDGAVSRYQYGSYESIRVFSALVSTETSESLLSALCQSNMYDYRIPPEGDNLELDEKLSDGTAFMLRGWLTHDQAEINGLDQYDPFRFSLEKINCTLGTVIQKWIESQPDRVILHQAWNDCPKPEDNHGVFTDGNRLWIKWDALKAFLESESADLIIKCDVTRSLNSRSYSEIKDTYASQSKLYLVRADGTIIGRRSDPEPRPEVGM